MQSVSAQAPRPIIPTTRATNTTPRQAENFRELAPTVDSTGTSGDRVTDNHRVTGSNRLIPAKIASMPASNHCPSLNPLVQPEEKSSIRRTQSVRLYRVDMIIMSPLMCLSVIKIHLPLLHLNLKQGEVFSFQLSVISYQLNCDLISS
ncbi:MAG: hypothetical protein VSS75_017495, partial [Candidatus Parabeggiatoa sp.]|nr:hypothetical protein [Candidatus Parabeggiatoa sp.]